MGLTKVLVDVVQLPFEVVRVWLRYSRCRYPRQTQWSCAGHPPVLVHRAVANKLELLRWVLRRSCSLIERVDKTDAVDWLLLNAVQDIRRCDPGSFINCRHNVDDVAELRSQTAFVLDLRRPRNDQSIACAPEMRCDLLG